MIFEDTSAKLPKLVVSCQGSVLGSSVDQLDFGDALADGSGGIFGESRVVNVENHGDSDLEITLVKIEGSEDFDLDLGSLQYRLPPGASSPLTIVYDPIDEGASGGTLMVSSNDASAPDFEIGLMGEAVLAACEISVTIEGSNIASGGTRDFGDVRYDGDGGNASSYTVFTISNIGNVSLSLSLPSLSGTNPTYFEMDVSGFSTDLGAGASTSFQVRFDPLGRGSSSAVITINNGDANENPYTINLTGKGCAPEIELLQGATVILDGGLYAPADIVYVGGTATTTFTIKNNGDDVLHLTGSPPVTLSGDSEFTVSAQPSATVNPGASTTFGVSFRSTWTDGTLEAITQINNDDPDGSESTYDLTVRRVSQRFNGWEDVTYSAFDGEAIIDYPNIYVIYGKTSAAGIYYKKSVDGGATWNPEITIDATGQNPNTAYYPEGKTAYISYYSGSASKDVKFATAYLGAAGDPVWSVSTPVSTGDVGIKNAVSGSKYGGSNRVYIVYYDATNTELRCVTSTNGGSTWGSPVTVYDISSGTINYISLKCVKTAPIYSMVAFEHQDGLTYSLHVCASNNYGAGFGHISLGGTPALNSYVSLSLDEASSGSAVVTYVNASDYHVMVKRCSSWTTMDKWLTIGNWATSDIAVAVADTSLAIGGYGNNLTIAYGGTAGLTLRYSSDGGATWVEKLPYYRGRYDRAAVASYYGSVTAIVSNSTTNSNLTINVCTEGSAW